jgi:hypothetical protein
MFLASTALAGAAGLIAMAVVPAERQRRSLSTADTPAASPELSPALAATTGKG